jgi:hypothetical protein
MIHNAAIPIVALALAGCVTSEFQAQSDICTALWMQKLPPLLEEQLYQIERSRRVNVNPSECIELNNIYICDVIERSENYTVNVVRTIDKNMSLRNENISACVQDMCLKIFGNTRCKPSELLPILGQFSA